MKKKILSMIIAIAMIVSMFAGITLNANAANYLQTTDAVITDGDYVMLLTYQQVTYGIGAVWNGWMPKSTDDITLDNGVSTENPALVWKIACVDSANGYYTIQNSSDSTYLKWKSNTNGIYTVSSVEDACYWTITRNSNNLYEIRSADATVMLCNNQGLGVRAYKVSTATGGNSNYAYEIGLYKLAKEGDCKHANATSQVTTAPTCVDDGVMTWTCGCGHSWTSVVAALGHSVKQWIVTTEPGCTSEGSQEGTCGVCGETITETISATGHSYGQAVVTPPTCTEQGYSTITCTICGYYKKTDYTAPAGHSYGQDGICTVCGAVKAPSVAYEVATFENVVAGKYIVGATRTTSSSYPTIYPATSKTSGGNWCISNSRITAVDDLIISDDLPVDAAVFTLEGDNSNGFTISYTDEQGNVLYLGYTAYEKAKLAFAQEYSTFLWKVIEDPDGGVALQNTSDNGLYTISDNSSSNTAIRGYATGTIYHGIYLFKQIEEENYFEQAEYLNEFDSVVIYSPTAEYAMSNRFRANEPMLYGTEATILGDRILVTDDMLVMTVYFTEDYSGDFYLVYNNSYLTCDPNSGLGFSEEASPYATWSILQADDGLCYIQNHYDGENMRQGLICYIGGFTTNNAGLSSPYQFRLYTKAGDCPHIHTELMGYVAPTCTESGYSGDTYCLNCGHLEDGQVLAATGHSERYTDNGDDHIITCDNCNYNATEEHTFDDRICICGAVEVIEPKYEYNSNLSITMNIAVGAEMQVIYNVLNSKVKDFERFYIEVVKEGADNKNVTTVYSLLDGNLEEKFTPNGNLVGYGATYTGIFAMEMGDNFTATLYCVAEDVTIYYGDALTSSIKTYLMEKLADSTSSAELKTLAVDMLNYGAAAQVNFGYDAENLVNADLTEEQLALGTQETPDAIDTSVTAGEGGKITTNVSLQSKVLLYVNCTYAKTADSTLEFVVKNANGDVLERFAPSVETARICQGVYGNVGARQMREPITIELYDNGKLVSQTLTWNIESYVAQTRAASASSDALIATVNAMLTYGDSAAVYLTASGQ